MISCYKFHQFFIYVILLIVILIIYQISGCGGGSGGGSSSSTQIKNGVEESSAKFYVNVTLKFPEKNKEIGEKLPLDLDYYEVKLLIKETDVQIGDTQRVDRPDSGNQATVTFWDVPEGSVKLIVKGYSNSKVLFAEGESNIDVSLASATGNNSGGSGGGSLSNENSVNNEPVVLPTGTVVNGPSAPKISEVKPKAISIGDTVTITGSGFGGSREKVSSKASDDNKSCIYFGGVKATDYIFWSDTYIVCRVPKNVSLANLNVSVSVGTGTGGATVSAGSSATAVSVQPAPSGGGGGGGGGSSQTELKKLFGGTSHDEFRSLYAFTDKSCIVAGYADSSNGDLSGLGAHGDSDGWIMKLGASGNVVYKKLYGGTAGEMLNSICGFNDGSCIVAGYSLSSDGDLSGLGHHGGIDGWIMKLDASGNVIYKKLYGGTDSDRLSSVYGFNDGSCIVAGYSQSSNGDLSGLGQHGGYDGWIMKLDASGNIVYKKLYGGINEDILYSVYGFNDGSCIVAGYSYSSDGDFTGLGWHGNSDGWIMKLDASGNVVYKKLYGGISTDYFRSVYGFNDGSCIVSGFSQSSDGDLAGLGAHGVYDGWIMKLDASGNVVYKKLYGGTNYDDLYSVYGFNDGSCIVSGSSGSSDGDLSGLGYHGGNDGWVMKLDSSGNVLYKKLYGGTNSDGYTSVYGFSDGSYIVSGYSSSSDGDLSGLGAHGMNDGWIVKLDANGSL